MSDFPASLLPLIGPERKIIREYDREPRRLSHDDVKLRQGRLCELRRLIRHARHVGFSFGDDGVHFTPQEEISIIRSELREHRQKGLIHVVEREPGILERNLLEAYHNPFPLFAMFTELRTRPGLRRK